jgi:hypothetical protein
MVLRLFTPERVEVRGGCGTLYSEEPHYLYSSDIIRLIKPRG